MAVLGGDKPGLAALYLAAPGAFADTPQGRVTDPGEEPQFWSSLHAAGLSAVEPKVLERREPQPGMVELVLRIDLTFQSNSGTQSFFVSATLTWVNPGDGWRIFATRRGDPILRPVIRLPEPKTPNPNLYPDPEAAQRDLNAALAAAQRDHKHILLVFGGNWCYDCHVLDTAFRSKEIAPLLGANYHVVHVNIAEYDRNADLAKRFEIPLEKGVPALAVLNSNASLLTSQKQGEFENAVKIGMADVTAFLERWKPTAGN